MALPETAVPSRPALAGPFASVARSRGRSPAYGSARTAAPSRRRARTGPSASGTRRAAGSSGSSDGTSTPTFSLAFEPGGRRLAAGGEDGEILIWDIATGSPGDGRFPAAPRPSMRCAYSPDGRIAGLRPWVSPAGGAVDHMRGQGRRPDLGCRRRASCSAPSAAIPRTSWAWPSAPTAVRSPRSAAPGSPCPRRRASRAS